MNILIIIAIAISCFSFPMQAADKSSYDLSCNLLANFDSKTLKPRPADSSDFGDRIKEVSGVFFHSLKAPPSSRALGQISCSKSSKALGITDEEQKLLKTSKKSFVIQSQSEAKTPKEILTGKNLRTIYNSGDASTSWIVYDTSSKYFYFVSLSNTLSDKALVIKLKK
ncbi:MAG: hypothetical protein SFU25_08155 [Candidatus Caenarcaniphilales bacterium]|nr:hypothetical protein [Candidatus Caenarcaniphilales bacterium]